MKTYGDRREVFKGEAKKTRGGLEQKDLIKNKKGKIVSLKKSKMAEKKKFNPLLKENLLVKKGSKKFGVEQMIQQQNSNINSISKKKSKKKINSKEKNKENVFNLFGLFK